MLTHECLRWHLQCFISRVATLLCTVGNQEMVGRVRFFAESYRLCVPELKSVGWQCAILGQLVGTTKIQDGSVILVNYKMCASLHYIMLGT